jgi:hypothetical protein
MPKVYDNIENHFHFGVTDLNDTLEISFNYKL